MINACHCLFTTGRSKRCGIEAFFGSLLVLMLILLGPGGVVRAAQPPRSAPPKLPLQEPRQITSEADSVRYATISADGRWLVYSSQRKGFTDLWRRSADSAAVVLPEQLTDDPANEMAPALSPDGRYLAYTGTAHDVKGDIYLLDLTTPKRIRHRLTGRETADGFAAFSADGQILYWHQTQAGQTQRRIVHLSLALLKDPSSQTFVGSEIQDLETGGDAAYPAPAPTGDQLAFVTLRSDSGGDIYSLNLNDGRLRQWTDSPALDLFPTWSPDGRFLYFARIALDTDHDGELTLKDHAVIHRIDAQAAVGRLAINDDRDPASDDVCCPPSFPLTAASYSATQPLVTQAGLYFLSTRKGVSNLWSLPLGGEIPNLGNVEKQFELAQEVAAQIPLDVPRAVLAFHRILERFGDHRQLAAQAFYQIGRLYTSMALPAAAIDIYRRGATVYADTLPWAALTRIEASLLHTRTQYQSTTTSQAKKAILDKGLTALGNIGTDPSQTMIEATVALRQAQLMLDLGHTSKSRLAAAQRLDQIVKDYPDQPQIVAEAAFFRAEAYRGLGLAAEIRPAYLSVIDHYPDAGPWADRAVDRILDLSLKTDDPTASREHIERLEQIATNNRTRLPRLAMGALNRMGDLFFAADELTPAKSAYRRVLEQYPQATSQTAAARLAMAEIFYREERFRQALDLYEREIDRRPYADRIYRLSRAGYIRKSIASGEFLFRIGEVAAARNVFKELLRYDDTVIEAHRGYIKCAAAHQQIPDVLKDYRHRIKSDAQDHIGLYATGLALTYLEDKKALIEARELVTKAIASQGQIEYYYQTLGYILEVLESVHQQSGNLELSLEAYRKAHFLNDPQQNPVNAANLMLNQGNGYFRLGQYRRAFDFYRRRLASDLAFENPDTEILFYRRFGAAAFQVNDHNRAIEAFNKALALVEDRIQPRKASSAFDDISRFVMDRLLMPARQILKSPPDGKLARMGENLAQKQSEINRRLFKLTQATVAPPPGDAWRRYRDRLTALLTEQGELNGACVDWIGGSSRLRNGLQVPGQAAGQAPQMVAQSVLAFKKRQVEKALSAPERFTQLRVEILDRLGLAYQEGSHWQKAKETFQKVFKLNKRLELTLNLVRSKRSVAYNTYLLAGKSSGQSREALLQEAAAAFADVIELVQRYGVAPPPPKARSGALIDLQLSVAQDERRATAAQFGFSATQEKRMAETFISRIKTELGELAPAYASVTRQLADYPPDATVPDKDLYGVSLLNHRAGLLATPLGQPNAAFDYFERSARMALEMDQVVSCGLNVTNMAHLLAHDVNPNTAPDAAYHRVEELDRQVSRLLAQRPTLGKTPFNAVYHNTMGVYTLQRKGPDESDPLQEAVHRMQRFQRAAGHFAAGLATYTPQQSPEKIKNREDLYRSAALHLNMAHVATELGASRRAETHLQTALEQSRQGRFPDIGWRALARLGRMPEALEAVESVTLLRASAQAGEIMDAFSPMVMAKVEDGEIEEAFNLVERLAELERVQRLAPLFTAKMGSDEKKMYRRSYRHLTQIEALHAKISRGKGESPVYLKEALEREKDLLATQLGPGREKLPQLAALGESVERQNHLLMLVGLALEVETAAEKLAVTLNPDPSLSDAHASLLNQYHQVLDQVVQNSAESNPAAGLIAAFGPNAAEAIDLMEGLPEGGVLTRLIRLKGSPLRYLAFRLTAEEIQAKVVTSEGLVQLFQQPAQVHFMAHEDLGNLPLARLSADHSVSYALSATHLIRCMMNRKPFKRTLLAMPSEYAVPSEGYELIRLPKAGTEAERLAVLPQVHTLLAGGRSGISHTVPTRAGENARLLPALELDPGRRRHLKHLGGRLANASLALLPGASIRDAYAMGHLFALLGCPTLMLPLKPAKDDEFTKQFLQKYPTLSVAAALKSTLDAAGRPHDWIQMGDPGMTPSEATQFAQENFVEYVKKGQAALNAGKAREALAYFENGTQIALEVEAYRQYLPDLYRYSRESAYQAGDDTRALTAAKALTELMSTVAPDSEQHAEALLRLGLLQARREQYEQALPILEESLEIITNLEDADQELSTLSTLGVVLENATEYDRALDKFMSAARLGQALDKKELLARQYVNLGRIYDLRLSRYARAKEAYNQALALYRELAQAEHEIQMMLDVGRCERLLGNFQAADKQYQAAWQQVTRDKVSADILKAKILIEQANNSWFQARYQEAFDLQRQALDLARRSDWDLGQVIALNTSGLIWWTLADYPRALRDLKQALALAEKLEARSDEVASTLNNLGLIYRDTQRYPEALAAFDRALAIDRKLKSRWAVSYDLRNQGLTYYQMGDYKKALPLFETAAKEAGAIGNRINQAKALLGLGQTLNALKQNDQAVETLLRALELARGMALRETQWRALHGLAKIKRDRGAIGEARKLLLQAVDIIEGMRAELKIDQLKEGFIENKTAVYETLVNLLVEQGDTTQAFDIAERSRARNFIDLLGNQRINLHGAVAQAQYDRLMQIKSHIGEQETLLAQATENDARSAYQTALDRLRDDERDLMLEIQLKNPQLSSLVTVDPLKLSEIQALLEPGVAVLAYYTVPQEIYCWLVTKDEVVLNRTPLSRDTLVSSVAEYRRMIQNLEPLEQQSRELFEWLLAPVMPQLKDSRYVGIIPHGVLHYLSFATLSTDDRYFIDDYPLFYLPSASIFAHTLKRRRPAKNVRVLAIGNPTLDDPALELPFAEREVESIKWNYSDITVLTRERATESWVKQHIGEFGIIHLASHGKFDPVNPLFSAVQLRKDHAADGDLEAAEVFSLELNADLVVLSACQTGIGRVSGGDEVVGLNRAYFYAGTHAIVSSLWRVSDISTAVLMKQFYRRYIRSNKSDGLRQAALHVKNRYPHPGYWGAFTLVGDYQ